MGWQLQCERPGWSHHLRCDRLQGRTQPCTSVRGECWLKRSFCSKRLCCAGLVGALLQHPRWLLIMDCACTIIKGPCHTEQTHVADCVRYIVCEDCGTAVCTWLRLSCPASSCSTVFFIHLICLTVQAACCLPCIANRAPAASGMCSSPSPTLALTSSVRLVPSAAQDVQRRAAHAEHWPSV